MEQPNEPDLRPPDGGVSGTNHTDERHSTAEQADDRTAREDGPSEPQALPKDVAFGLLSVERRRAVLRILAEVGPETTLSDLADRIAAAENETEVRLVNSTQRKRVYVALYQCHLPKMDDAGVIDFNEARGTVVRRPPADQLDAYLAVDPPVSDGDG